MELLEGLLGLGFTYTKANNLAETVLDLLLDVVSRDGEDWPERIRDGRGVENALVCNAMISRREKSKFHC